VDKALVDKVKGLEASRVADNSSSSSSSHRWVSVVEPEVAEVSIKEETSEREEVEAEEAGKNFDPRN
jgi:hypothetical protein